MIQDDLQKKKSWIQSWWTRAIAGFLAVAMATTVLLANAVRIQIPVDSGSASEYTLSESTDFVKKNMAARMEDLLRQLLVNPSTLEQHYRNASVYIGVAKYDEALAEIDACLSLADGSDTALNDELWLKRGCLETLTGAYDSALESFTNISSGVYVDELLQIKAQIYAEQGNAQLTAEMLEAYLQSNPGDNDMRVSLASAYLQLQRYEDAIGQYRAILEGGVDDAGQTFMLLASAYMLAGQYEEAIANFLQAKDAGYSDPSACLAQCALASYLKADYASVISYGDQAISTGSEHFTYETLCYYMALAQMNLGAFAEAITLFSIAINQGAEIDDAYYFRGACYMVAGEMDAAIADFTTVIEKNVEALLPNCYFNRGICAADVKDYDMARSDFEEVLRLVQEGELYDSAKAMLDLL
ncbi:MAG: tetratricopeptide repeat protein [Eubacteriales bacterium]|nr:tetratricopeptide repeat protein [Eubacteriales bacterium]